MTKFDPKVKIERLLLKYPALAAVFAEAAPAVDQALTVEEFCFVNGVDVIPFFRRLDGAIAEAERLAEADAALYDRKISGDKASALGKVAAEEDAAAVSGRAAPVGDYAVAGLVALATVVFACCAVGNLFADFSALRSLLGIRSTLFLPHSSQMLGLLNALGAVGGALLLFRYRIGIIIMFAGAMLNDVLVVALTNGAPYETILSAAICLCLMLRKPLRESLR